jgi:Rrf2 family transcriptional regulator, iron-sulfur cluster assembly transcription factor
MIFGTTTEYALRGIAELEIKSGGKTVLLDQLIVGTDLPREFMAKVMQRMVKAGLLLSSKGRGGGFKLAKPSHEIRMLDILIAMEGEERPLRCVLGFSRCNDAVPCAQHDLYKPIRQRLNDYLTTTTVADLAASLRQKRSRLSVVSGHNSST